MSSGPVDHAKHPADRIGPPRSVWLRILRLAISLVILWCLWLVYPLASVRISAARLAAFFEPDIDPRTAEIKNYVLRRGTALSDIRGWEERLESQSIPQLLALLPSRDPRGIWIVSRAIESQLRLGRIVGWSGTREAVPPLDADAAKLILQVLHQDLPPVAAGSLVSLLGLVPPELPEYDGMLLRATEHRQPLARVVFTVSFCGPQQSAAVMLIERLDDSDVRVRMAAADALGATGPDAGSEVAAALAKMAKEDKFAGAQMTAIVALGKLPQHIQAHRKTLEELSERGDLAVRGAAAKVLRRQTAPDE